MQYIINRIAPTNFSRQGLWTLALLVIAALAGTLYWVRLGLPVTMADAPSGRITCVSYAPYYKDGEAPYDAQLTVSAERIENDLRALSQRFDCVRTYSVGKGLSEVPRIARKLGMKVLLGVWLNRSAKDNEEEMQVAIQLAQEEKAAIASGMPATLRAIIVGNEVLLRGELSQEVLAAHIRHVRRESGLPVTYADVWEFWLKYREVEKAVDFVTIHILPYWEDKPVAVERAVAHVENIYNKMRAAFPDKQFLIGETGWPSAGRQRWGAVPSLVNEARFFREFLLFAQKSGVNYNVIEAFDQPWKRTLEGTVGGYWGVFNSQLEAKFPMAGPVVEEPRWAYGLLAGGVGALLFVVVGGIAARAYTGISLALLALSGYGVGAMLFAQLRQMLYANRYTLEWAYTGAATVAAVLTTLSVALLLARRLKSHAADAAHADVLAIAPIAGFAGSRGSARWLGLLRALWLFVIVVIDLLFVFDARYRDFPNLLMAPVVAGFLMLALTVRHQRVQVEEKLMAASIGVMGVVIVVNELPINGSAVLWVALGWVLAATVLLPRSAYRKSIPVA